MDYSRLRTVFTDITVFSLPVIFIFFAAKRYFPLFVPFVFALLMVLMLTPLNNALKKKSPPVIAAVICTLTAAAVFVFLIYFTLNYALKGLYSFADALPSIYTSSEAVFTKISARFSFLGNKARNPSDFTVFFYQKGAAALHNAVSGFFKDSADFILSALKNIPSFVITVFTAFLSAFFILLDGEKISAFFKKTVPPQTFLFFCKIKNTFCGAVFMYIKAQLTIAAIIFTILFAGLCFLSVEYAALLALIIAIVDAVPILGTGTVMLPWAVFSILSENPQRGWGLLALYGICALTRQFTEPKIIGDKMGIHPLASIFSIYAGMKLLGIFGIIIGPVFALFVKDLIFTE